MRPLDSILVTRAFEFLGAGPSDPAPLVSAVCQQPGTPAFVAEHLAVALLAGDRRFCRLPDGKWALQTASTVSTVNEQPAKYSGKLHYSDPSDALDSMSFVVVDVETTGGRPFGGDRITEIGAVVVEKGRVLEEQRFEQLVNPMRPIPHAVSRLTHISWEMVKNQPTFAEICDRFLEFAGGRVFVAHNAGFDWRFLNAEVQRARGTAIGGRRLCTVSMARKLLTHLPRRSLANVARHYGVEMTKYPDRTGTRRYRGEDDALVAHTAAGDAVATAHVLVGLLRDARSAGCESWFDLEALTKRQPGRRKNRRKRSGSPSYMERDVTT
jgi:DNA polymerase III subunit epsilon